MGEKIKEFLQKQSDKDADDILAQINADPEMADVHAPDEMEASIFALIDDYENEKAHSNLSEEDKELIELGKAYKKSKKRRKYAAVASIALVGLIYSSVTAMGGPEKVIEKMTWMLGGREQTMVDADSERIEKPEGVSELEAFERIEKEFGFTPVKMFYMPKGIDFQEYLIDKETQYVNVTYQGDNNRIIIYEILSNYKIGSLGGDMEDNLLAKYTQEIAGMEVLIRQYAVEENEEKRWVLEFKEDSVYYIIQICNLEKEEVEKIIENIYFHK